MTAAEAAGTEATLSHASVHTVQREAFDRLHTSPAFTNAQVTLHRDGNGTAATGPLCSGESVRVTISAPAQFALPQLLARLTPWLTSQELVATVEVTIP